MSNKEELEKLKAKTIKCNACDLRTGASQVVFGEGALGGILVIGEGPGAEEDAKGRPFVGRSGQLLDKILEASGFSRDKNVYIANIVKCRPPANRTPLPDERAICIPWLMQEIEIVDPKIIILLGATALQGLVDKNGKITKVRGTWLNWQGRLVMPTYHPAALLRNPRLKADVWDDMKKVIDKYREIVDPDHHCDNY